MSRIARTETRKNRNLREPVSCVINRRREKIKQRKGDEEEKRKKEPRPRSRLTQMNKVGRGSREYVIINLVILLSHLK